MVKQPNVRKRIFPIPRVPGKLNTHHSKLERSDLIPHFLENYLQCPAELRVFAVQTVVERFLHLDIG